MTDPYSRPAAPPPGEPAPPAADQALSPAWPVPVPWMGPATPVRRPAGPELPARFQPLAGTPYGLAYVRVPPVTFGPAVGALVAGVGSIVVAVGMSCLGLTGAGAGRGALVAGAFAILAVLLGGAGIVVGTVASRAIRRSAGTLRGHGTARTGSVCGCVGVGLSLLGFLGVLALTLRS